MDEARTEADSYIGSDGRNLQQYILDNQTAEPGGLALDPDEAELIELMMRNDRPVVPVPDPDPNPTVPTFDPEGDDPNWHGEGDDPEQLWPDDAEDPEHIDEADEEQTNIDRQEIDDDQLMQDFDDFVDDFELDEDQFDFNRNFDYEGDDEKRQTAGGDDDVLEARRVDLMTPEEEAELEAFWQDEFGDSTPPPGLWARFKNWFKRKKPSTSAAKPEAGTEMSDLGTLLAERPRPNEISLNQTEYEAMNDLVAGAREQGLSDSAIASELGIGMSDGGLWISRATLGEYIGKQFKGMWMAPGIAALQTGLNALGDGAGDMVAMSMIGWDALTTGDPLGLVVLGITQIFKANAERRTKQLDNDHPDKLYGTRMGYVREGDTWYPAVFNKRFQGDDQEITFDYGHEIVWRINGEGAFVPVVPDANSKSFVATDDEWDMNPRDRTKDVRSSGMWGKSYKNYEMTHTEMYGQDFVTSGVFGEDTKLGHRKLGDSTRDWFFLSDEDTRKVWSGTKTLSSYTDDVASMNPAARQINDWRKALDLGQNWKWSTAAKTAGAGSSVNSYAGSRQLQRVMREAVSNPLKGVGISSQTDYDTYVQDLANHRGPDWDSGTGVHHALGDFLRTGALKAQIDALYKTQKAAAKEAGFDHLFQTEIGAAVEANDPSRTVDAFGGTPWSALYLDTGKDMPTAVSAEELAQQVQQIELMSDRTPAQRNYLAQKVQTRYWIQQSMNIGQGSEVMKMLKGDWGVTHAQDMYEMTSWDEKKGFSADKVIHRWNTGFDYLLGAKEQAAGRSKRNFDIGYAMPWQNAGESYLPTLTGALTGTANEDLLSDAERYLRLTREAQEHTADWIARTSNLDPNKLIQGTNVFLREGGIYADNDAQDDADTQDTDQDDADTQDTDQDDADTGDQDDADTGDQDDADTQDTGDQDDADDFWLKQATTGNLGDLGELGPDELQRFDIPTGWRYARSRDGYGTYIAPDGTVFVDWGSGYPEADGVPENMDEYADLMILAQQHLDDLDAQEGDDTDTEADPDEVVTQPAAKDAKDEDVRPTSAQSHVPAQNNDLGFAPLNAEAQAAILQMEHAGDQP